MVLGLVYGIATGGAIPFLIERVYPVVFAEDAAAPARLLLFCLLPVLVMLARALAGFGNTYLLNYCGQHLLEHLRARVFDTMQRLPLAYFQKNRPGALISRAMQDTQLLRDGLSQFAQDVVKQPVTLLAAIGVLIYLTLKHREVGYLLLFILSVPVVIVPLRYFGKKVAKRAEAMLRQQDELTQQLSQNLGALYEIRAFNLQERESRRFSEQCREFTRRFLRVVLSANLISPAVEVVAAVAVGIALYYSAQGSIPQEAFLALLMALYLCYEPVKMIGRLHARVQQSLTALDRIEGVLQHPPDLSDPAEPKPWREPQGEVRFENVTFAYADASVLRGVDVTIPPGQTVALVGPSGAGKTTFCNLIPRFFDVGEGSVRVDGIDVREMAQAILREHIAIVPQEPTLFHDTIANNIRVGRLDATEAEVR
ncbi:MAG: ABC transporter ATP-binding protein, partial [Opitutales bacterium]